MAIVQRTEALKLLVRYAQAGLASDGQTTEPESISKAELSAALDTVRDCILRDGWCLLPPYLTPPMEVMVRRVSREYGVPIRADEFVDSFAKVWAWMGELEGIEPDVDSEEAPQLECDAKRLREKGRGLGNDQLIERHILWNFLRYLQREGFECVAIYVGRKRTTIASLIEAMEMLFSIDEVCSMGFAKGRKVCGRMEIGHGVGMDVLGDWVETAQPSVGFTAAVDRFQPMDYVLLMKAASSR